MEKDDTLEIRRLNPAEDDRDAAPLKQAYNWIQARAEWFPFTGGKQTWEEYLADALRSNQLDFAVMINGEMVSLITVDSSRPGQYQFHLASKPQPPVAELIKAVYRVGHHLFSFYRAEEIYTEIPSFHHGSRRLAEKCGLRPDGAESYLGNFHGQPIRWIRYAMSRATFEKEHER